jgi:hydrogenase maturation protease
MRHIICFGNPLHGDDGFGHAVYQRLCATNLPADIKVFDAGIGGLNALALFENCEEAILIDASAPAGAPGWISRPSPYDIPLESGTSGHCSGVGYLLRSLTALNAMPPRVRIVAAEAASVTPFQPGLSAAMAQAVNETVAILHDWITGKQRDA